MTDNLSRPAQPIEASINDRQSATWLPSPRLWVDEREIKNNCPFDIKINWLLGYKDVGSSTNERTLIATILPHTAIVDSVNLVGIQELSDEKNLACLLGNFNSFILDYIVRQKTGGLHIKFYLLNQLPVLPPTTYAQPCLWSCNDETLRDWILPRVLELTYTAWDLEPFACDCVAGIGNREIGNRDEGISGYIRQFVPEGINPTSLPPYSLPPFKWNEARRFLLRCELDAAFFHLYLGSADEWRQQPAALTDAFPTPRDAVAYIMDTFPIVKRKDEAAHGSYRTRDTILEMYDAMQQAMTTSQPYQTRLDPPPADIRCCHPPR